MFDGYLCIALEYPAICFIGNFMSSSLQFVNVHRVTVWMRALADLSFSLFRIEINSIKRLLAVASMRLSTKPKSILKSVNLAVYRSVSMNGPV